MRTIRTIGWLVPALLALAACHKGVPGPDKTDPVSADEAKALADRFAAAVTPCSPDQIDQIIDGDNLMRRALQKTTATGALKEGMARGLRSNSVGTMFCQGLTDGATYKLLRMKDVGGQPRPLFRLLAGDAVNYHELELGKSRKDHQVRVVDIRIYATGDLLSESVTQMLDQAALMMKSGADPTEFQHSTQELQAARASGDNAKAREILTSLPAPLRNTKPMRLAELMIASDLDEKTYADLMEQYQHDFPGDPSSDVVGIDYFYLKKDVDRTVATVERLDQRVGGDPHLAILRAGAYMLEPTPEHVAEAEKWARKATEGEPDAESGWWTLANVLLKRGDRAALAPVVDTLRTRFHATIDLDQMLDSPP